MTRTSLVHVVRAIVTFILVMSLTACGGGGSGDDTGDVDAGDCAAGTTMCTGNTFQRCEDGAWVVEAQCPAICDDTQGCLACRADTRSCDGETVMQCNAVGTGEVVVETCMGSEHCSNGACVDLCADAAANRSYLGCEYYAIDLDNAIEVSGEAQAIFGCALDSIPDAVVKNLEVCYDADNETQVIQGLCDPDRTCPTGWECTARDVCVLDAAGSPFAIVVSNPHGFPVTVTLATDTQSMDTQIPAGTVQALFPQMMGFPDRSVDRSMQGKRAYRITANAPIVAYQFNPLEQVAVFSNDGSLLIPRTTWDTDYYVMSWPTLTRRDVPDGVLPSHDYNGYVTIVAAEDGVTVEVTPTAATRANGPIPAIAAGETATFTLDAFDVLNLEAVADGDLTGTRVRALDDKAIGVFGGHEAISVPQSPAPDPAYPRGPCCADHVEEMLFPASTWGKEFAIARSKQRNGEPDRLRVMAQAADTTVTFTPAPVTGTCGTLGAGEWCEVKIAGDTAISSTQPILIGHYLESVIWSNNNIFAPMSIGTGDPSMALAVPVEQFRTEYQVLVPAQYMENHVAIATSATGTVSIDGMDVTSQLQAFGAYRGGRVAVTAGPHTITCNAGCGIEIMGYSGAVSYLFAGGLDLRQIVVD